MLTVTLLNPVLVLPRVVVPARSNVTNPLLLVNVEGVFQVAPLNVNVPADCGAMRTPVLVASVPFKSSVYVVAAEPKVDAAPVMVNVPLTVFVPVEVVKYDVADSVIAPAAV